MSPVAVDHRPALSTARRAWLVARLIAQCTWGVVVWTDRLWRLVLPVLAVSVASSLTGWADLDALVGSLLAALVALAVGETVWPGSCERFAAGPVRRAGWRHAARRSWPGLARDCGLSVARSKRRSTLGWNRDRRSRLIASITDTRERWRDPRLVRVRTHGDELRLTIRARSGQTPDALMDGAPGIAATLGAVSHRCAQTSPNTLLVTLTMRDVLADTLTTPADSNRAGPVWDAAPIGTAEDGTPWLLTVRGRHTLVVGCSGAGKGSVTWGVVAALAPHVPGRRVQLWGIDLKRGVELAMGRDLWHTVATTPDQALDVLRELLQVIDARGADMIGHSRLHTPAPGSPLHVLVVDELAAVIAYADTDTRREASRLLAEVLTQGRALGVVVLACVQDPRKETVGMRGLFTQTVALRLRTPEETRMVLGDGMTDRAPAHRISPTAPGTGYLVGDDGTTARVRAYWWDDLAIRHLAHTYPALADAPATPCVPEPAASGLL